MQVARINPAPDQTRWRWLRGLFPKAFARAEKTQYAGLVIALCFLLLAVVTWVRVIADGTLKTDDSQVLVRHFAPYVGMLVVVGAIGIIILWLFAKAFNTQQRLSLERLLFIALLIHGCAFPALPIHGDLYCNLANGRLVQVGLSPYQHPPADLGVDEFNSLVQNRWFHSITPYGPINTWISRAAVSAGSLWASIWAFKAAMLLSSFAMVLLAYGFCRTCLSGDQATRSFLLLAWNPLLAWSVSAQAHNDGPMLVCATAFVWAAVSRWEWTGVGCLVGAFYAKFAVAPLLGLYLCHQARRGLWRAGLTIAAVAVAGYGLYYPFANGPLALINLFVEAGDKPSQIAHSLINMLCDFAGLFGPQAQSNVFWIWSWTTKLSFLALGAYFALRARTVAQVIRYGLIFLILFETLGKGWIWPWYMTWLLPLAMAETDVRLQRVAVVYTLLAPTLYLDIPIAHCVPLVMLWRMYAAPKPASPKSDATAKAELSSVANSAAC